MKVNRKASIIVYVMVLLTFAIGFSYLVLSNLETMNNNINLSKINNFERKTLYANAILNLENDKKLNSDGNWFIDEKKCPTVSIELEWWGVRTEFFNDTETALYFWNHWNEWIKKRFYCKVLDERVEYFLFGFVTEKNFFNWEDWFIFNRFIPNYHGVGTLSSRWKYYEGHAYQVKITEDEPFSPELDNSSWNAYSYIVWAVSINLDSINWKDWIDDDVNDDNFKVTSSQWSYPDGYFDNDADARKNIFWTILENKSRVNIFVNSEESNNMILENTNNVNPAELLKNSSLDFKKLPEMEKANFEINFLNKENFSGTIEIVKISKTSWQNETKKINFQNSLALIQNLDFKNNYYQLFLNVDSGFETKDLLYKISEKSWAYINPIRDDLDWKIEIYQNIVFNYAGRDILKWQNFSILK